MKKKSEELIPIEYKTGPGWIIRQKLRQIEPAWRVLISSAFVILYVAAFAFCLGSPERVLLTLPLVGFLVAVIFLFVSRDEIVLGKGGIAFPASFGRQLQYSFIKLWTELDRAEVLSPYSGNALPDQKGSVIRITFRSGTKVVLPLSRFTKESLVSFVSAIEKWATECKLDKQFPQLPRLHDFETANPHADKGAYTQFWDEELADSYSFTAFVPISPGKRLQNGRLVVLKEIAAGGFSAIYLVRDEEGGQRILKESVLPHECDQATRDRVKAQFEREATLLVKLSHENIARVFDHFVENGRNYLVLEYVEGPDLREFVRKNGAQREGKVLEWGKQLAGTLAYLHAQTPPVVHRDVTPDNIVLSPQGKVVLIDFGAANEFVGTATGTLIGKQSYMAPEQIRGKANPQSDVYGLGATLFFLINGKDPEPLGVTSSKALKPEISEATDNLISRMTRLDLDTRVMDANEAARLIETAEKGLEAPIS